MAKKLHTVLISPDNEKEAYEWWQTLSYPDRINVIPYIPEGYCLLKFRDPRLAIYAKLKFGGM